MNILVTGGAGYIGSHVVKQLLETTNNDVVIIDNLSGGNFNPIPVFLEKYPDRVKFFQKDLADFGSIEKIFSKEELDAVIHFAAYIQVGESVSNPTKYYMNNTVNTTNLINLCQKYDVEKFIFSSTAAVYGEPDEIPIKETTSKNPINPYGMSKLMSEAVLQDSAKANEKFNYVILRYFNVAGAASDGLIGESHVPETHLIPLVIQAALGQRESIKMFGDDYPTPDGSCIRDYVHVEDLADAHIQALRYLQDGNESDVFNCGYGHGYSVKEVIETVKKVSGIDFKVEIVPRRVGDPAELVANSSKIKQQMRWKPRFDDLELICSTALKWERKKLQKGVR